MEFTPRIRDILTILLEADGPMSKQEIADRIGVSKRTAQREFEYLDTAVHEYHLELVNQKGAGTYLSGEEENKNRLKSDLSEGTIIGAEGREERCRKILFTLLKDHTPKKLFYFSNMLGVSEATAANDMELLRPWLSHYHLELIKRPGYGVTIDGSEEDFSAAMRRFIADNGAARLFTSENEAMGDAVLESIHKKSIYSLLKQDTVDRVRTVLGNMDEPQLHTLADNAYMGLIIHISIAVERIKSGGELTSDHNADLERLGNGSEYELAERILKEIEKEFEISMPKTEISFLMLHLRASKSAYSKTTGSHAMEGTSVSQDRVIDMIDRMITAYSPELSYEMKNDEDFLNGLIMHLKPVLVRIEHHLDIYNPILSDIKKEYPEVFQRCRAAASVIEEELGQPVSDEEIGFLAMHFGAVEEKIRNTHRTNRKVNIGVVCASGFGLAKLMVARIRDHISANISLTSYGRDEITPFIAGKTDFFVSSFDLSGSGVDFVQVSPLITQADITHINAKISEYAHIRRSEENKDFARQLDEANFATVEIKGLIQRYHHFRIAPNVHFDELVRFLAMKASANLADAGRIIEGIKAREELNTQVFPDLGLCLLHCKTNAVEQAVVLTCTPRPAEENGDDTHFEDHYFQGARAAVLMLIPDDTHTREHQEIVGQISMAFVKETDFLECVFGGDEGQIREALVKILKGYFYQFLENL